MSLSLTRACVFALALGSATASCTFNPSGQVDGLDGSIEPRPDADPLRPDANPVAPDARPDDASPGAPDASVPPDAGEGCAAWLPRPRHFDPCAIPPPSPALLLTAAGEYVYDTNTRTLRDPQGDVVDHASGEISGDPPVVVVSVDRFVVGSNARLRVTGGKPLLVASWSTLTVDGTIDVSSNASGAGAGANTGTCDPSGSGGQDDSGGGGGGGGGFSANGGTGGQGDGTSGGAGGRNGRQVMTPVTVRGGCPGAAGGGGQNAGGNGAGGNGGGALQLTAQVEIRINGDLLAGGQGGSGANGTIERKGGGGGGGSGGLLGLEAPSITIEASAVLAANGGGGGEGANDTAGDRGDDGLPGTAAAAGGSGGNGGDGGFGGARAVRDGGFGLNGGSAGANSSGGGGGGGGAGYIILEGNEDIVNGAVLSPVQTPR